MFRAFERCHPRRKKGKDQTVQPLSLNQFSQSRHQKRQRRPTNQKVKRKKTVTAFTEDQNEEVIEFLMSNEVLYSKRLAGSRMSPRRRISVLHMLPI